MSDPGADLKPFPVACKPIFARPQIPARHGWYYFGIVTAKKVPGAG
jgi:hypothetical protein